MRSNDAAANDDVVWGRIGVCLIAAALLVETAMAILEHFA